ncbi:MAG: 4Fe-4S dicluster domain-containing protein [Desulfobulbaceae bacterium]|nr:MAG: 4Fe-4S dicluster domain-containing protein [Desulfobulbaceae bacterium]
MEPNENDSPKVNEDKPPEPAEKPVKKRSSARKKQAAPKRAKKESAEELGAKSRTPKTLYRVKFFYEWCKSCGICSALCPKEVILLDDQGNPFIEVQDDCIGCRNCEIHCPDFAITVSKRYPSRRSTNGV